MRRAKLPPAEELLALHDAGKSVLEIAAQHGVSYQAVYSKMHYRSLLAERQYGNAGSRFQHWTLLETASRMTDRVRCRCSCGQVQYIGVSSMLYDKRPGCRVCRAHYPEESHGLGHAIGMDAYS